MFEFIVGNLSTLVAGGLVLALLLAVGITMLRDKKKGKNACGCHCAGCPSAGICHTK